MLCLYRGYVVMHHCLCMLVVLRVLCYLNMLRVLVRCLCCWEAAASCFIVVSLFV